MLTSISSLHTRWLTTFALVLVVVETGCSPATETPAVMGERANLLRRQGKHAEALEVMQAALAIEPDNPRIHFDRGATLESLDQPEAAIAAYTDSLKHDERYALAYNNRGVVYAKQGQLDIALADFEKAIELDRTDALAYRNRGLAFLNLGKLEESVADFSTAIRLDNDLPSRLGLADVAAARQDWAQAVPLYTDVLDQDATIVDALIGRAEAATRLGDSVHAEADWAKARALDPKATAEALAAATTSVDPPAPDANAVNDSAGIVSEFLLTQGFKNLAPDQEPNWLTGVEGADQVRVFIKDCVSDRVTFTPGEFETLSKISGRIDLVLVRVAATSRTVHKHLSRWNIKQEQLTPVGYEWLPPKL